MSNCGPPIQSYNGLERDGVTARQTIHCSDVGCKKRQAKAIKLSLPGSAQMSVEAVEGVVALMRQTREEVLRLKHQHTRKSTELSPKNFQTKLEELKEYTRRHGTLLCAVSLCLLPYPLRWSGRMLPCQTLCHVWQFGCGASRPPTDTSLNDA